MEYQLECPVCEQRFTISEESSGQKVKCPGCSRSFKLPSNNRIQTPSPVQPAASTKLPTPLPLAQPIASGPTDPQPAQKETPSGIKTGKPSGLATAAAKQKRQKRKMIRGIAMILGLATIVGILSGLLVMRLQEQANKKKTGNEIADVKTTNDGSDVETAKSKNDPQTDDPSKTKVVAKEPKEPEPEKRIRHEELPPPELFFHEPKEAKQCWDLIYRHLVNLTVHDAHGTHKAIGTIVDSRGWIVTNYSTIKGASKIEVTPGYKTIDQHYLEPTLTDSVRGVITSDPEQDLAVLSINRRFIDSFADLAITDKDYVVEGEFMLQCGPPTPKNPYSSYESKIAISGKLDDLPNASKTVAKSKQLTSPQLPWLVCPDKQNALPGAPLVRINGTLEAIHVFSQDKQAHYVPVHRLKELLSTAVDEPQPLNTLNESQEANGASTKIAVGVDHPIRESSVQLNRLSEVCQQFNWIPTDKKEYDQLQEFSQHFATAHKYIKKNQKSDPELVGELKAQTKQIKKSISAGITKPDQAAIETMNQLAAAELKRPNRIVPFFGRVIELEVSVRNDVLELVRTDPPSSVALNPDQSRDPFYRGDVCLALVEVPAEIERKGFTIEKEKVAAVVVDLITRIDVSK